MFIYCSKGHRRDLDHIQRAKVKIRPGETLKFERVCPECGECFTVTVTSKLNKKPAPPVTPPVIPSPEEADSHSTASTENNGDTEHNDNQ